MNFTDESKELINEIIPFLNKIKQKQNFIKKKMINNTIKYIYNELEQAEKIVNSLLENNKISQKINIFSGSNKIKFPGIFTSRFVVSHIQKYIKKHIYGTNTLSVVFFNHKIDIIFYLIDKNEEDTYVLGNPFITNILVWLYIASKNSKDHCAETLKIHSFMTPFKKKLPENDYEILSPTHCNSAVTTSCIRNGEICIYRKEEFLKVLIHESFHIFGLDFSGLPISRLKKNILKIFPIQSDMELSESYTETWATLMNCFICARNLSDDNNFEDFLAYVDFCIRIEQIFSVFQLIKILNFMSLNYKNLYEKDDISVSARRFLYRENTNVFAYYILKTVFLCNIDYFLNWCKTNNIYEPKKGNIFNFYKTPKNIDNFENMIKRLYKEKSFLEQINNIERFFSDLNSLFMNKTTRMTICELN